MSLFSDAAPKRAWMRSYGILGFRQNAPLNGQRLHVLDAEARARDAARERRPASGGCGRRRSVVEPRAAPLVAPNAATTAAKATRPTPRSLTH